MYLQDFPSDVFLTALTLDAKHGMVIHLTVGNPIPVKTTQNKRRHQICFTSYRVQSRASQSHMQHVREDITQQDFGETAQLQRAGQILQFSRWNLIFKHPHAHKSVLSFVEYEHLDNFYREVLLRQHILQKI